MNAPPQEVRVGPSPAAALGDWRSSAKVIVAVPDHTRSLDVRACLDALAPHLSGPWRAIVGLGLHRRMTPKEMTSLAPYDVIQHDPDDCVPTAVIQGVPGAVHRAVAQADWSISVGVAELHQYAGLSGGHKGVAVGCGGRETILALHQRDRVCAPDVQVGRLDGNPFREVVDALGRAARCRLALVHVPARDLWIAGEPEAVLQEARRRMSCWAPVRGDYEGAVLSVPSSKARSLYQASRAATYLALSPNPPLKPGAVLVLDAACAEGLGSESGFSAFMTNHRPPWSSALTGTSPPGPGGQRAVMLARLARRYRLKVCGCASVQALMACGIDATAEVAPRGTGWLRVDRPFEVLPQREPKG